MKQYFSVLFLLLLQALAVQAQTRSTQLTIQVNSVEGDDLDGQAVTLLQTDFQVSYGTLRLNGEGTCTLKVYPSGHRLTIEREGFAPLNHDFTVGADEVQKTVTVTLAEKTRTPFALTAKTLHNVFSGTNSLKLSWNREAPAFFDDFESYEPFAVSFGQWTGIDADLEAAAPLVGAYPNRGVMQYAQIINPLTVTPTWWYDYPILRPYSGQQYVGFTRTSSGNQNDDWLISPAITVGTDNVLTFMGKAADQFPERFMVYVTEKVDNPVQDDFTRIDKDNYETADYRGWHQYSYDLSPYAGKQLKFAIRCISHYNRYGSFMLMIDDVYVGQVQEDEVLASRADGKNHLSRKSPANPNEHFNVYLDGTLAGTTDGYELLIPEVTGGKHLVGVQAAYIAAQSELTTIQVDVPAGPFASVTFNVLANSVLTPDGQTLSLTSLSTSETYELTISSGKATVPSLPYGPYVIDVAEGAFEEYQQTIQVNGDTAFDIVLNDRIIAPYNITATANEEGTYTLRWNQELIFSDSFEDYDDFATGSFGGWKTVNVDQFPCYPIALGSMTNIVSFPGSGTAANPTAIAPMVFNPYATEPAMMPTDQAIAAPTGVKTIIFFSAQQHRNDKWLISPLLDIHEDYKLTVKAKGYTSMYPESLEFCVSEGGDQPTDFMVLSSVDQLSAEQWSIYETDLAVYAGQTIRLAVHYTSNDAFLAQIDDFTVGPENGQGETVDYGNVIRFEIFLDGTLIGESTTPSFTLPPLSGGSHTIGIRAIYQSGQSEFTEYTINATGIAHLPVQPRQAWEGATALFNLQGQQVRGGGHGLYLIRQNGKTTKICK